MIRVPSYLRHRGYPMSERLHRTKESVAWTIARHLPKRVMYWAIVVAAVEVEPSEDPSNVKAIEMMDVMSPDHKK